MKLIYFDCFSGASGDKIVGALIDAGLSFEDLKTELEKLNLPGYTISTETMMKQGIAGTKFNVVTEEQKAHRHLRHIVEIIDNSGLSDRVKERSKAIFGRLAEAEAKVHNTTPEKIHFHEVGAIDAIVDVVGAVIGLELLGIDEIHCSPMALGTGFVKCEHGTIPVPVPATVELLRGLPVRPTEIPTELTTPTGAAILSTLANRFGIAPSMSISSTGYGAGFKQLDIPNHLRVMLGDTETAGITTETADLLETNIDDMNPELFEYVAEKLYEVGAVDVYFTPIQMKKNRPAIMLSVLSPTEMTGRVIEMIFRETTSIGLRHTIVNKKVLPRETVSVTTELGDVRVKLCRLHGEIVNRSPEYEDCRRLAEQSGKPLKEVFVLAIDAARKIDISD